MVYSNKFVMTVLRKGQVQKELANGTVRIPFGEYALRFRNKNNRRAVVKFFIDGENVSGNGYIVPANGHIDIERHHDKPSKFNFVALDSEEATDFGKNGPNPDKVKGTIEARFYLEKERTYTTLPYYPTTIKEIHHHHYPKPTPWYNPTPIWTTNTGSINHLDASPQVTCGGGRTSDLGLSGMVSLNMADCGNTPLMSFNACESSLRSEAPRARGLRSRERKIEEGCTVEGSHSNQNFTTQYIDYDTENYVTLRIFLEGFQLDEDEIEAEVTAEAPKPKKSKAKKKLTQLEEENERLRRLLAEKENRELKEKLGIKD